MLLTLFIVTAGQTPAPSKSTSESPSLSPSKSPTYSPTASPSTSPSAFPTESPSVLLTTYPSFSPTRSPIGHSLCDNTNYHGYDGIYKDGTLSDAGCRSFCISTIGLSGTPDVLRGYVYTKRFNHRCSCLVDHPMSGTYSGINGVFHGGTSAGVIGGWNQTDVNDAYCYKLYPTVSPTKSPSKSPSTSPTANPSVSPSAPLSTSQTVSPTASPSVNRANSPYASPAANPSVFPRFHRAKARRRPQR